MRGQPESAESTPLRITTIHVNSSSAQLSTAARTAVIPIAPPLPSNIVADGSVSSSTVDTANAAAKPTRHKLKSNLLDEINAGNFKLNNVKSQAENGNPAKSAQPAAGNNNFLINELNKLRDVIDPSKAGFSSENNAETPLGAVQSGTGIGNLLNATPSKTFGDSHSIASSSDEWLDKS